MRTLTVALFVLSTQWLLGALLLTLVSRLLRAGRARRRWIAAWTSSARALCQPRHLAVAFPLAAATFALLAVAWSNPTSAVTSTLGPAFLALGAAPTAACHTLIHAGHRHLAGRLTSARPPARLAGQLLALGALAQLAFAASRSDWTTLTTPHLAGAVALILAAFVALSAGLAAKPHPSSYLAAFLYAAGIACLVAG